MKENKLKMIAVVSAVAASAIVILVLVYQHVNRPAFALEVDATRDTTDISGTLYRVRMVNIGKERLTGIIVELGKNDTQSLEYLDAGQSFYFYPKPDTLVTDVTVKTNEGILVKTSYRTPTKVWGLPGAGR